MVATPLQNALKASPRRSAPLRLAGSLSLIQGSLSARRVVRQAPWLAGLHRLADGALLGLGVSMLGLSALTLHWQNQWGSHYRDLEATQILERRLQEAAAVLEQHHLGVVRRPGWLVPTSSAQLVHVPPPAATMPAGQGFELARLRWGLVAPGY
ncbi:MAG: hypothetical protein VKM92_01545 [Cyanobacteriota bacterium]|nr:hypothetical protein [Cyanobacteriota bacterium]